MNPVNSLNAIIKQILFYFYHEFRKIQNFSVVFITGFTYSN